MSKLIQAFLSGVFFTFFLDFFLFLGIKLHYIDFYEIDVYYNILFADNQNIFIYLFLSLIIGYLVIYVKNNKIRVSIVLLLFIVSLSTLIKPIGYFAGEIILMTKNITIQEKKYHYVGDIYYNGREQITFFDYKLDKIILLNKKDIKQ